MRPRGGLILGCGRPIRDGKAVFHEYLRIEARDGTLLYTVQPMGREPVQFRLESFEQDDAARTARYTFKNPDHARQHTIEYRWAGDAIAGRIAGERDGQPWEQQSGSHVLRCHAPEHAARSTSNASLSVPPQGVSHAGISVGSTDSQNVSVPPLPVWVTSRFL